MINQITVIEDRNFDSIAQKFVKNIYGSDKGDIRQAIIGEDIEQILETFYHPETPLTILDAGGGLAQLSQNLAKVGHHVTLCDISGEMLQLAKLDIKNNGLLKQYRFIHSPIQLIDEHVKQPFDFVIFHAVMEWLAEPKVTLQNLLKQVKASGVISVMFYNHYGLIYKNVVCGNIPHILDGMPHRKRFKLQPQHALKPEDVYQWIEEAGFEICGKSGIRCFSDYIGNVTHQGDYQYDDVLALEKKLCRQEPYLSLGRYIHVWATKK